MPPERVFGNRYQIIRHIARGGMAQVYLARDLLLDRPVALKALFPELSVDEAFVERFRREAQAAANLSHPNIVSIYDWGQGDNTYYIVMEFVDGETLSARIRRGPLPAEEAAAIGIATAAALSFAHDHNVIHRDVKPGNVLIDKSGHVKVADFGIARAVGADDRITQAGAVMGTATYFSPEQAQGRVVDARSDVYSLGVVLYEMVVGRPPFQGENPVAIAYKHVGELPVPPRTINPAIPPAYEAITLRALAKSPADRYPSAAALRADLERFSSGLAMAALSGDVEGRNRTGVSTDATIAMAPARRAPAGGAASTPASRGAGAGRAAGAGRPAAATISRPQEVTGPPYLDDGIDNTGPLIERRSRAGLYIVLLILLVAALAVLGYFIGRNYGLFGGVRTLTVPSVSGRPAATAEAQLRAQGFTNVTESRQTSATVAAGTAIGTDPAAGSREKANSRLVVDVSQGRAPVPVPSVDGDTAAAAHASLRHAGFKTTVGYQADNTVAKGDVVRTSPANGTRVTPGSTIQVIVSSGPTQVAIPNVMYEVPVQAGADLSALGFKPSEKLETSATVPAGEVTRTVPAGGASAPYGSTVTVYVSSGPALIPLPSLIGETEAEAASQLAQLGLQADFISEVVTTVGQNGLVQVTDPLPGTSVDKGSTVQVAIGAYVVPTTTTVPASTTTTTVPPTTTTTTTTLGPGGGGDSNPNPFPVTPSG